MPFHVIVFHIIILLGQLSDQDKQIVEFQLSWLVYIIGAAIGGRISINSSDEHDALDGDLIIKGFYRYKSNYF